MSEALKNETSQEERFLGVRHTVQTGTADDSDSVDKLDIEVVDDRPDDDKRPPVEVKDDDDDDDDELESYSEKVQKRIKKLSFDKNELRRQKEEAERVRDEAINVTKNLWQQSQQQDSVLKSNQAALVQRTKQAAENAVLNARASYKEAFDAGETDKVIEAQEALIRAQAEWTEAHRYEQQVTNEWNRPKPQPQPQERPRQPPKPSEKAQQWADANKWFGSHEHKDMTALAYGIHEKLVTEDGIDPNSDAYFRKIDSTMRKRFPEYFNDEDDKGQGTPTSNPRPPTNVVAPAKRNNGASPRKVRLSSSQVALAKRLGITPEQYAKQLT